MRKSNIEDVTPSAEDLLGLEKPMRKSNIEDVTPVLPLKLLSMEKRPGGIVWLRYAVRG